MVSMIKDHLTRTKPKAVTYSSNTHRGHSHTLVPATQLSQGCDNLAGTGSAQGVTESTVASQNEAKLWGELWHDLHSTTTRVHLTLIQTQLVDAVDTLVDELVKDYHQIPSNQTYHGSKSLVNLKNINLILVQAKLAQNLRDSQGGANAHNPRLETSNCGTAELANNRLTQLLRLRPLHQHQRRRAVCDLTSIATGGSTGLPLGERSADLAKGLGGSPVANTIIPVDDNILDLTRLGILNLRLDRHNLLLKPTRLLRMLCLLVAPSGELIVLLAGNAKLRRDVLRRVAHGHVILRGEGVLVDALGHLGCTAVGVGAHALRAHGDADIDGAGEDLVGDVLDG